MMCNWLRYSLTVGLLYGACAGSAWAAPTVFFARDASTGSFPNSQAAFNQFTSALNLFGVDDIEGHFGANPTLTFGTTGIQATTHGVFATSTPGFALTIDDVALTETENAVGGDPMDPTFTFNQYISAFGLYVIQGGDMANNNPTTFRLTDTATNAFVDVPVQIGPGWEFFNIFFLGIADTVPFDQVTIIESIDAMDGMLFDNVVAGFIPEPASLLLLVAGGVCALGRAAGFRRRRD